MEKAKQSQEALYEKVLQKLEEMGRKVKRHNDFSMVQCIFHNDHEPSLKVTKYGYICFSTRCEKYKKFGSLTELAEAVGIKVARQPVNVKKHTKENVLNYVAGRLRLSLDEAKEFMRRMNIVPYVYEGMEGVLVDTFNGVKKFRSLLGKEYRWVGETDGTEPAFSGLIDLFWTTAKELIGEDREYYVVALVEGTFDALTLWHLGVPTLSIEGAKYSIDACLEALKKRGIGGVILAFDNDETGRKYTKEGIEKGLKAGFVVYVLDLDKYKDVNQFYVEDPEGLKKAIKSVKNVFEWEAERHKGLLDRTDVLGKRFVYSRLVALYDMASDKVTAHELLVKALENYGLKYDEWVEELERLDLIRIEQQKRERLKNELRKAIERLDEGEEPSEILHTLVSSAREYTKVDARTMAEDPELLGEGFPKDKCVTFSLLPGIELYPSDILLISAKTKAGKTTLALNLFHEVLESGLRGLYVTYELTKVQIFELFVALASDKPLSEITREDKEMVARTLGSNGIIREGLSLDEIIALVHVFNPHVFFIDYDQLVTVRGRFESEERRVAHITWTLKELARSTGSVCVLLSQENEEEKARYSREKEHCSSVHIHLEKDEDKDEIEWEVRLNRWGKTKLKGKWLVDFSKRKLYSGSYTFSVR